MADTARLFLFLTSSTCFVSKYFSRSLQRGNHFLTSSLGLARSCAETWQGFCLLRRIWRIF